MGTLWNTASGTRIVCNRVFLANDDAAEKVGCNARCQHSGETTADDQSGIAHVPLTVPS